MTTTPATAPAQATEADVIAVEAGSAGSTTAYRHASAGADVLIFELAESPRGADTADRVINALTKVAPAA